MMYLFVTGTAQRHEVRLIMRPALRERDDVVDFLHSNIPSVLQALFTERMLGCVPMPDACPGPAVTLAR